MTSCAFALDADRFYRLHMIRSHRDEIMGPLLLPREFFGNRSEVMARWRSVTRRVLKERHWNSWIRTADMICVDGESQTISYAELQAKSLESEFECDDGFWHPYVVRRVITSMSESADENSELQNAIHELVADGMKHLWFAVGMLDPTTPTHFAIGRETIRVVVSGLLWWLPELCEVKFYRGQLEPDLYGWLEVVFKSLRWIGIDVSPTAIAFNDRFALHDALMLSGKVVRLSEGRYCLR